MHRSAEVTKKRGDPVKKRILSILLAAVMLLTMLPVTAMAANAYYINGKTVHYDDFASSPDEC